jgi:hypothetical protein
VRQRGALVLVVLFLFNEQRHSNPLVPLPLFKIKGLWEADVIQILAMAGFYTMFFLVTLYISQVGPWPVRQGDPRDRPTRRPAKACTTPPAATGDYRIGNRTMGCLCCGGSVSAPAAVNVCSDRSAAAKGGAGRSWLGGVASRSTRPGHS